MAVAGFGTELAPHPAPDRRGWSWPALAAYVLIAAALLIHARRYAAFLSDDALISLRYARRFVEGHGLTWTAGERVEGYTDFLWVLLAAAGGRLGFDYIGTALFLDKLGVLLALAAVGWSPRTGRWSAARLLTGGALLAASIPMAVWANGGLEHGLMTGVLAVGIARLSRAALGRARRPAWMAGLPFAALALLRADGVVLAVFALAGGALAVRWTDGPTRAPVGRAVSRLAGAGLPVVAVVLGQLLFRRVYYGQWQPNTALAKLALNAARLRLGLTHVGHGYLAIAVLLGAAVVASLVVVQAGRRATLAIAWAVILGWTVYLTAVGGDIFPGWRQLLLVLPPLAAIVAEGGEALLEGQPARRWGVAALVMVPLALGHLAAQSRDSENRRAAHELWEWDGFGIGTLLKRAFGARHPLHAVDAAGALPYWSELPSLDMLGLNDFYLAHHPPPGFGHGPIGHELGDGAYVFSRAPDLISFNNAGGAATPAFLSGEQMLAMPAFHRAYQWIRVQASIGNHATAEIWVRREGGKLGVRREAGRIEVPGYFLTGQASDAVARLDARGTLVAELTDDRPGVLPALELPAGRWAVSLEPPAGPVVADVRCDGRSMEPRRAPDDGSAVLIELDRPTSIDLALAPAPGGPVPLRVAAVVFRAAGAASAGTASRCVSAGAPLPVAPGDLQAPRPEHSFWAHPADVMLGPEGMTIRIAAAQRVGHIDLTADNNDAYALAITRGSTPLWRGVAGPRANGGGLAERRLELSPPVAVQPGDTLTVTPEGGDGAYSVGHLRLED